MKKTLAMVVIMLAWLVTDKAFILSLEPTVSYKQYCVDVKPAESGERVIIRVSKDLTKSTIVTKPYTIEWVDTCPAEQQAQQ